MPAIETLFTFALASLLLSISPGPSNLYIMARSINQGHKAGFAAAGGMAIGSFIYVLATALGIAVIFQYSPMAYTLLKLAGAAYLIFLGIQYFYLANDIGDQNSPIKPRPLVKIFRQSIVVELTNPKTALFFLAFLPQFVNLTVSSITSQLLVLGVVYAFIAFACDLCVAKLSGQLGKWLSQHHGFILWQDRLSGSLLICLGGFIGYEEWA